MPPSNEEEQLTEALAEAVNSMDFDRKGEEHRASIDAERRSLGLAPLPPDESHLNDVADAPSCDGCGKDATGKMTCTGCRCAKYCGRDCQSWHWKNGHKAECDGFQERCDAAGSAVVSDLGDASRPPVLRMQRLERLDGAGPYKAARQHGLHEVLASLLRDDTADVLARYRTGSAMDRTAYVHWIMMVLWRGQRVSRAGSPTFGCCDGERIKKFLSADPENFALLWEAMLALVQVPLDDDVYRNPAVHAEVHQCARDVLAGFSQVFTNDLASKFIFLGPNRASENAKKEFGRERVQYMAKTLLPVLRRFAGAKDGRDRRDVLEGYLFQNSAMIDYRRREYEIDFDFVSELQFSALKRTMYYGVAKPLGEATIAKGYALNNSEAQVAMQRGMAEMQRAGGAGAAGKKAKGGKKARRGRK